MMLIVEIAHRKIFTWASVPSIIGIEQSRCATDLADHRAAILFSSNLAERQKFQLRGENIMKEFNDGEFEGYNGEVRARWGNTDAYKEYSQKTKNYEKNKWSDLVADMDIIFNEFALCMKNSDTPEKEKPQKLVEKLQNYITENYYTCTKEILFGLGKMYVADERFKNNIDKHGAGTAAYVQEAISCYCKEERYGK